MPLASLLDFGSKRPTDACANKMRRRRLMMQALESRRVLATLLVTSSIDVLDESDGVTSFREALASANATAESDTILFDANVFALASEIDLVLGELSITNPVEIVGSGRDLLVIDAQNLSRVMNITAATGDVSIEGLTLTGGRTFDDNVDTGGAVESLQSGGGIRFVSDGTLTIRDSTISGNETAGASALGGGLFVEQGNVVIADSIVSQNRTRGRSAFGGGIFATDSSVQIHRSSLLDNVTSGAFADGGGLFARQGTVEIKESVISGNRTTSGGAYGGGMYVNGSGTTIRRTTITGNSADGFGSVGGGIAMHGDVLLINSTIANNTAASGAGSGGGIATISGELNLIHSTVTGNAAAQGVSGGIIVMNNPNARLNIFNSIVAGNTDNGTAPDFQPPTDAARFLVRGSLIGDNTGTTLAESQTANSFGNIVGAPSPGGGLIDPLLGPLANNGGPVPTRLPLTGSPVIDVADPALSVDLLGAALTVDHRGFPFQRSFGNGVDMGAVEVQPAPAVPIVWDAPQPILVGSELALTQLNATANVSGTFIYTPPLGTVLEAGEDQVLSVQFVPDDNVNYSNGSATVTIDVVSPLDYGDAPTSYATLLGDDGARHGTGSLRLGATVGYEADGQPSVDAAADTGDDGVLQISPILAHSSSSTTTSFLINVSSASKLDGWIDFNGDGTFDHAAEHIGGGTSLDLAIRDNIVSVNVPAGAVAGPTYARFRVSTDGGLTPNGLATDGEVEDYVVTIVDANSPQDVAINLPSGRVTLAADGLDLIVSAGATELFRAPSLSVSRYEIAGADSSDVLVIDYSSGDPIPANGLAYDGGDRVNTVQIVGDGITFDASSDGNVELTKIDSVQLGISDAVTLILDATAMNSIDPDGGGLVVTGGQMDNIQFADPPSWRFGEPLSLAGSFFTRIETGSRFIQTDLPIAWHNFILPNDINNDRNITAGDALRVINELTLRRFSDPTDGTLDNPADFDPFPGVYFDQNADGRVSVLDALRVINQLSRQSGSGEGEISAVLTDPHKTEPLEASVSEFVAADLPVKSPGRAASFEVSPLVVPTTVAVAVESETSFSPEDVDAIDQVFADLSTIKFQV